MRGESTGNRGTKRERKPGDGADASATTSAMHGEEHQEQRDDRTVDREPGVSHPARPTGSGGTREPNPAR